MPWYRVVAAGPGLSSSSNVQSPTDTFLDVVERDEDRDDAGAMAPHNSVTATRNDRIIMEILIGRTASV